MKTIMTKIDSTKERTNALAALAKTILSERGIDVTTPTPHATLLEMYSELARRGGCHKATAKKHILRAIAGSRPKKRGGARASVSGEEHHWTKLSDNDAEKIRCMYAAGTPPRQIASEFGVSYYAVYTIAKGIRRQKNSNQARA